MERKFNPNSQWNEQEEINTLNKKYKRKFSDYNTASRFDEAETAVTNFYEQQTSGINRESRIDLLKRQNEYEKSTGTITGIDDFIRMETANYYKKEDLADAEEAKREKQPKQKSLFDNK